jgi:methionyl-tRNA formyltransferase
MRVLIATSLRAGLASLAIPRLVERGVEVALVALDEGLPPPGRRWPRTLRKLKKAWRIGLFGALNGLRMRRWYLEDVGARLDIPALDEVCRRHGLRFERVPSVNSGRAEELFRQARADLGLSLGGGYIAERIFSIPRLGMINVHHELLPAFRGAQSVLWQLYHGSRETGYTIHRIDRGIDTGPILYQERLPIEFRSALRETVTHNYARLFRASAAGLVEVVSRYEELAANAQPQPPGPGYTTPSLRQFCVMWRQHRRLAASVTGKTPPRG